MGNARSFPGSGTTDYLRNAGSAVFNYNDVVCCIAQIKPVTIGTFTRLFGWCGVPGSRGWYAGIGSDGTLRFGKVAQAETTSTLSVSADNWYTVLCAGRTLNVQDFKLYTHATSTLTTNLSVADGSAQLTVPATDPLMVGNKNSTLELPFGGIIQRVAILQGVPSDSEFTAYATSGTLPSTGVTVKGAWTLAGDSPELDLTANGNNLAVTGTTIVQGYGASPGPMFRGS